MVWFGLVLWHINYCWLVNAKSCFYIYNEYMIYKHILWIAESAGAVEYTVCFSAEGYDPIAKKCSRYDTKQLRCSNAGVLGNAEYPFNGITPRSTRVRRGSAW